MLTWQVGGVTGVIPRARLTERQAAWERLAAVLHAFEPADWVRIAAALEPLAARRGKATTAEQHRVIGVHLADGPRRGGA